MEKLKAKILELQKVNSSQHELEQALGALSGNVAYQSSYRRISNELDFDSHLCNRVDMLLNQKDNGYRIRRNDYDNFKNLPQEADKQQEQSFRLDDFEEDKGEEQPAPMKKKSSKKFKKPEAELLKLRSRTETPSKAINVRQEIDHQEQKPMILQGKSIAGLTRENLLQLDAMNNKQAKSPGRLLQKHLERQQKAEMLRAQIVQNRREQMEKIRRRQQDTKTRHDRM